jgi:DNA-directed RNA polymerase subunit RPC12/RpoP
MAIHIKCEHCGHILNVPDDMKGKKVRCPNCDRKTVAAPEVDRQFVGTSAVSSAPSKYDSLRVMGRVFVFVGYLLAIIAIAYGLCRMAKLSDPGWTREGLIDFLIFFIAALVIFVACKFAGELSRVLADIGDNEANILKLLRELGDRLSQSEKR